ncbi:MAG: UbiA family prenyltransferase [Bacteroidota bacterium]
MPTTTISTAARWWTYQRERFPLAAHGPLVAAFSLSAMSVSAALRGGPALDPLAAILAVGSCLLFFLFLRIADEFKDYAEDCRYRPYRPVPRGLVSLRELGALGIGAAVLQLSFALALSPRLVPLLFIGWAYFGLMCVEFFRPDALRARPLAYLGSHMVIVPLIDLYATAFDWAVAEAPPPPGLGWFAVASFFNGVAIEVGRKVRAPEDEEPGVETYSARWGLRRAVAFWMGALVVTALPGIALASLLDAGAVLAAVFAVLLAGAGFVALRFVRRPRGRAVEVYAGLWTLAFYGSLGLAALLR